MSHTTKKLQNELFAIDLQLLTMRKRFYIANEFLLGSSPPPCWCEARLALTNATNHEDVTWALDKLQDIWERETNLTGI